ncbi:MAG: FHA domain-containing protein [Verrucomicrobia subdivision 3 bacterium]|nr:FHA domain-containing protein [Limisphaerales bacterium]
MPKLVFLSEQFTGRSYDLVLEKTTVGRGEQNTLTIHDPSLSSTHCEILVNGPEVIVRDLNSSNGTYVDGAELRNQQCQVKAGQTIRFGSVEARLELDPEQDERFDEHTAIYAHSRAVREQRRARKNPQVANPAMTLEPSDDAAVGGHTVLIPRSQISEGFATTASPPSDGGAQGDSGEGRPKAAAGKWIAIAIVVIAVLVAVWLIWNRK